MARKIYYVSPDTSRWKVATGGTVLSYHPTQASAKDAAITTAKLNQPSQVIVQGADGQFQSESTYGSDPFPPRG